MVKQFYCGKQLKSSSTILMALCSNFFRTAFNLLRKEVVLLKVLKIDGVLKNIFETNTTALQFYS